MQRIGSAKVQQWIKYGKCISERLFYCVTKLILAQDDSNHLQLEQEELNILTGLKPHTLIFHFLKSQFNSTSLLPFFPLNALLAIISPLNPSAGNPPLCDTFKQRLLKLKWSTCSYSQSCSELRLQNFLQGWLRATLTYYPCFVWVWNANVYFLL